MKPGETIAAEYSKELDEMRGKHQLRRQASANRKGPTLLHDNARPHILEVTLQKVIKLGYETYRHRP